ncbi:hypothetical protein F441_04390 [Phytophthora nicotianae CJ01A1]|uniref:DUF6570 domain-containing protein n=2 Tax=Phytophthora nicotianae TaxID=4792 RepID=W2HAN2_PHYNI|nr:hypothetical protein L915_04301 [Phytophthora nicotianae]ETL98872.1 hypothetical protein L917_04140 [Phytophthora nicotianae]ETP22246.1 hypothetical protein F441_04390 [Phytophthora nicotianae CJ01A1]
MQPLQEILSSEGEGLPTEFVADCDCSALTSILDGVVLSKRGVRRDGNLNVCQECNDSLAKRLIRQMHRVRRQVVNDVLRFYQQNNEFYDGIVVDSSEIPVDAIAENMIFEDVEADVELTEMGAEHD